MAVWIVSIVLLLLASANGQLRENYSSGKHLIAGTGYYTGLLEMYQNSSGHAIYSGRLFEQLDWLAKRLHFTYDMLPADVDDPGFFENGTWHGQIGYIVRKEVDIAIGPIMPLSERLKVVDFAGYAFATGSSLLVKYPEVRISKYAVIDPFDWKVWLYFSMSFLLVCAIGHCLIHRQQQSSQNMKYDNLVICILSTITAQGSYYNTTFQPIRLLAATWCLAAFVMVNVYSSVLISFLSAQYQAPEINSMADLAENENYKIYTLASTRWEPIILNSTLPVMRAVSRRYTACADCKFTDRQQIIPLILERKAVAFQPTQMCDAFMTADVRMTGRCRLTLAKESYAMRYLFFALSKSSPYVEEINRESLWIHAMGLNIKWSRDDQVPRRCMLKYNSRGVVVQESSSPLKLVQLQIAFYLLLAGYLAATLCFLREVYQIKVSISSSSINSN